MTNTSPELGHFGYEATEPFCPFDPTFIKQIGGQARFAVRAAALSLAESRIDVHRCPRLQYKC
jgi:hypothetical protein